MKICFISSTSLTTIFKKNIYLFDLFCLQNMLNTFVSLISFEKEQLCLSELLYVNIHLKLWNKLHGQVHYEKGVTCVYNGHMFYTLLQ